MFMTGTTPAAGEDEVPVQQSGAGRVACREDRRGNTKGYVIEEYGAMRRRTAIRMVIALSTASLVGGAAGPASSPARAGIILETATLGPNPAPAIGIGGIQWIGARFS